MDTQIANLKTLVDAVRYFSDLNRAHAFFATSRWPNGAVCPRCGSKEVSYSPKYRRYQCKHGHDGRQFTVKTGSVMEDSPLGLDKWAVAFWLEVNAKNSISSYEIHRALGITQKTAWFMLHRVRLAVKRESFEKMSGTVEADETVIGGLKANMHKDRRARVASGTGFAGKTIVMGLLERHTEKGKSTIRTSVLKGNANRESLHPVIYANVKLGSTLMTDALSSYVSLGTEYVHHAIDHAEKYAEGIVHTNGIENFWSLFKRCIKGTHISIEPFHLESYLDSEAFRFDNRELHDGQRFVLATKGFAGKRLMYRDLITRQPEFRPGSGFKGADAGKPN